MKSDSPLLDPRVSADILATVRDLFQAYFPDAGEPNATSGAVLKIFADMTERLLQRLNRVPEKYRIAFFNFMNMDRLNPRPARTVMTFRLVPGVNSIKIPEETELSVEGRRTFRTTRELTAVPARLSQLMFVDPLRDKYRELTKLLASNDSFYPGGRSGGVEENLEHTLYMGLLNLIPPEQRKQVPQAKAAATPVAMALLKRMLAGLEPAARLRVYLRGDNLTRVFFGQWSLNDKKVRPLVYHRAGMLIAAFRDFKLPALSNLNGAEDFRLKVEPQSDGALKNRSAASLPMLRDIRYGFQSRRRYPDFMYANTTLLSPGKDIRPFGKVSAVSDALYLGDSSFQWHGGQVVISVEPSALVGPADKVVIHWEYWDGDDWFSLGYGAADGREFSENGTFRFSDGTWAFTRAGSIRFRCPPAAEGKFNGRRTCWLRAVLMEGNYGAAAEPSRVKRVRDGLREISTDLLGSGEKHAILTKIAGEQGATRKTPATLAPPILRSLKIKFSVRDIMPDTLQTCNGFQERSIGIASNGFLGFQPFHPFAGNPEDAYLYLGFEPEQSLPGSEISMLCAFNPGLPRPGTGPEDVEDGSNNQATLRPRWEYLAADRWRELTVHAENDEDMVFRRGDIVRFLLPADAHVANRGKSAFWIRIGASRAGWEQVPLCSGFFPNAVFALNASRVEHEILGSSGAHPGFRVRLAHAPVPGQPVIRVRESVRPGSQELAHLVLQLNEAYSVSPPDPIQQSDSLPQEYWVAWVPVKNFALSGPGERHYTFDAHTGEIVFGDGRRGRLPPVGTRNIRADYFRGGGRGGNLKAGGKIHAHRHIPGIEQVSMPIASSGGMNQEEPARALQRAPRMLRTGGRALTRNDFEELARAYSDTIHRVRCFTTKAGLIQVMILASASAENGTPAGPGFLMEVERYLKRHASLMVRERIRVLGPVFVRIDIRAGIRIPNGDNMNEALTQLEKRLKTFLHPMHGGRDGRGREFGADVTPGEVRELILKSPPAQAVTYLEMEAYRNGRRVSAPALIRGEAELALAGRIELNGVRSGGLHHVASHA